MLRKLFIKNYKNTENKEVRNKYGTVAGMFGIISNLFIGVIKLIIGIIANSVSIIADSVNNISDTSSSLLTIIGFKLAKKAPDKEHPYGYARYEYISGFVIALLMLLTGGIFAKESIAKIFDSQEINISLITYIILGISIVIKILQVSVYTSFSKAIESDTLKASAQDSKNDILSTIAIIISMIIMQVFNVNIDGYVSLIISILIIISSLKMAKEVLQPIIGIIPTHEQVNQITKKIESYDCVKGYHDLVIHNYGVHNDFVTVHIEIDSKMSMLEAHDMMDNIENDFREDLGISLTIHMDPIEVGNKEVTKLNKEVKEIIKEYDK